MSPPLLLPPEEFPLLELPDDDLPPEEVLDVDVPPEPVDDALPPELLEVEIPPEPFPLPEEDPRLIGSELSPPSALDPVCPESPHAAKIPTQTANTAPQFRIVMLASPSIYPLEDEWLARSVGLARGRSATRARVLYAVARGRDAAARTRPAARRSASR